jgi:DNA-binding Lrp family transcriptional regulator
MNHASSIDDLDTTDRSIINALQGGFPVSGAPYADAAKTLGMMEGELIERLRRLLDIGALSRFGPMYNADKMGGANVLAAMKIAEDDFERVAEQVNAFDEVSHNYERDHVLNMWFVISTENSSRIARVVQEIEHATGYRVYPMPKEEEFFVGLKFEV